MASSRRKGKKEDFKQEDVLQAVVIADSFNVRFAPLTKQTPKALLPMVNVPLLEYTLEFLCASGIQEVIIFCCSHASQIKSYLETSKWKSSTCPMDLIILISEDCLSVGDALRDIDAKSLISNDFVLVTSDIVANAQLKPIIEEHKARRLKDKNVVMTLLLKKASPSHKSRCKEDDVVLAVKPENQQILSYQKAANTKKFDLPLRIFTENKQVQLRYDLLDSHVSICSPHVVQLFTDNFDFETRDDFVRGILVDEEILGHTVHIHELNGEYAARVTNVKMYDAVSRDIMNRWVYPMVPDNPITESKHDRYSYRRRNIYLDQEITLARGSNLQENVIIGKGSDIGPNTNISNSVVGKRCNIGENVELNGVYMWDDSIIENDCKLTTCILDKKVHIKQNVVIKPGCMLGTGVIVGPDITLEQSTLLSSQPPEDDDFGEDDPQNSAVIDVNIVGEEGRGYVYRESSGSDSEADVPPLDVWGVDIESDDEDSDSVCSETLSDDRDSPVPDEPKMFFNEVISTLDRAREENINKDNLVLEINSVKHAYGIQINEVNHLLTKAVMELPLKSQPNLEPAQFLSQVKSNFEAFVLPLMRNYIRSQESQTDCLISLEEFSMNNSVGLKTLVNTIHYLYDKDLLSEEVIMSWYRKLSVGESAAEKSKIVSLVKPFITWLTEAEEESDEDEDEDSDD